MRGDGVGVGDVGAVPCSKDAGGQPCGCIDSRRASRDDEHGAICGRRGDEHSRTEQHSKHGIGVGDGAWIRAGDGSTDGDGTRRGDGMRGDGVGVGDVGAVQDGVWRERKRRDDGDGGGEGRELDGGMVGGRS